MAESKKMADGGLVGGAGEGLNFKEAFGKSLMGVLPMMVSKGDGLMGGIPALLDYNAKDKDKDKKAAVDASMKTPGMKRGGAVKKYAKGGSVGSASKRADGCAQRGKTRGKMR
jgi:hypothetical protein